MNDAIPPVEKSRRKPAAPSPSAVTAAVQKRRLREVELLLEVSRKMSVTDSLDEVLNTLLDATTSELNTERGTLFLNDYETNELYSRVAQGSFRREIRILNTTGVGGHVFTTR
jgi:adenylate cyclase